MRRILVAVDGSAPALRAVRHGIDLAKRSGDVEIHLINVQQSITSYGALHIHALDSALEERLAAFRHEAAERALAAAKKELDAAGLGYQSHVLVGDVAETVAEQATRLGCEGIVLGTRGMSALPSLALGSVAMRVLHHATVPVTLVK